MQNFRVGDYIIYELGGINYKGKILRINGNKADIELCLSQKKSEKIDNAEMKDIEISKLSLQKLSNL